MVLILLSCFVCHAKDSLLHESFQNTFTQCTDTAVFLQKLILSVTWRLALENAIIIQKRVIAFTDFTYHSLSWLSFFLVSAYSVASAFINSQENRPIRMVISSMKLKKKSTTSFIQDSDQDTASRGSISQNICLMLFD